MDDLRYYEQNNFWRRYTLDVLTIEKIHKVLEIVPKDVRTIIDIGCGNGLITNELAEKFQVVGVDRSRTALKYVKTLKICADVANICVHDKSFDLVFCSEVLEHLSDSVLNEAIMEMKRISNKYIFLTVPNNENLRVNFLKCPQCGFEFNVSYHQQSFNIERIKSMFKEYELTTYILGGGKVRAYNSTLLKIRQKYANGWYKIDEKSNPMCPMCGNTDFPAFHYNILSFICDGLNKFISKKHFHWLYALFEMRRE